LIWVGTFVFCAGLLSAQADEVDECVATVMNQRHIPGLSLAIIQDGHIIKEKGYGYADLGSKTPVTPATLFQAGSISKPVAAVAALHLVEQGRLSLDADVNTELRSWKVPENEFTRDKKVTLRGILSHNAGLTVHGFPGYAVGTSIPTLLEVLDGTQPANTAPIRVDMVPRSQWRYSGGGYTVLQQMITDVTGKAFPDFMRETVLLPLGMTSSTFEQPLPASRQTLAATAYGPNGQAVKGRWHIYPEMAAAGLWTTATNLARFVISLQQAFAGASNPVLSQSTTRLMLTRQKDDDGLGVFLKGEDKTLQFWHNGRDEGFDAFMAGDASHGEGVAILINTNDDNDAVSDIIKAIAKSYGWP
jgi:CubicO group peptidase (beta-lactamase class C family)